MIVLRSRILGLAAAAGVAAITAAGCDSDLTDDPPPGSGTGGSSGTGGGSSGSGGQTSACTPTDPICYGGEGRPTDGPGSECMANIDNTGAPRVQFRQTWNRSIKPLGNAENIVYDSLKQRVQIELPQCYQTGGGGYMQLFDWDRSNSDITQQTMRVGYANYHRTGAPDATVVVRDGLCMIEWSYQMVTNPPLPEFVPPADKWPGAKPQPWQIAPIDAKRVAEDFDLAAARPNVAEDEGIFYADESTGWMHVYFPLGYVTVLDTARGGLAVPIREVEQRLQFNDSSFNCLGRFRADALDINANCDPGVNQKNPQWGCKDDAACPPPGLVPAGAAAAAETGPGASPGFTRGYFLIVDLERVFSGTLGSTLCVSYPRESVSTEQGWSNTTAWGKNCRGSPKWNPTAANDTGLPVGDWCSRTNSPATGECHDAYLNESYSTAQAFKIKPDTCGVRQ